MPISPDVLLKGLDTQRCSQQVSGYSALGSAVYASLFVTPLHLPIFEMTHMLRLRFV
jgi:hypothetical protein